MKQTSFEHLSGKKYMNKSLASKSVDGIRLNNRATICIECANKSWREKEMKNERRRMNSLIPRKIFSAPNHVKSCRLWFVCPSPKAWEEERKREKSEGNNSWAEIKRFSSSSSSYISLILVLSAPPSMLRLYYSVPKLFSQFIILIRGMQKQVKHLITWLHLQSYSISANRCA